jgi:hypothetical protein
MWTDDLITLGYLLPGGSATRALRRFQRHAKRRYRKTAAGESVSETAVYLGPEDGVAGPETLDELARWLGKEYRLPLGFFKLSKIAEWGWLREDMASEWLAVMAQVEILGGSIDGPYGDTRRPLMETISVGASKFSFHICGRAVDLNQGNSSYFPVREMEGAQTLWRIWVKTADQSGAQGSRIAGATYYCFWTHSDQPLPDGYYFDLTAEMERGGCFERIPAQDGWQRDSRLSEWWHFQWVPEKQTTFQDECELIGITEQQLRTFGYADADLDHTPG